ncbi:hypothetical protein F5Y15DRAFT_397546 [Xylariaceae sp. FL0016]|nr:hypothetical protein F5Y15DRAFT_397546 [Xylariaceae sp. FL0016]
MSPSASPEPSDAASDPPKGLSTSDKPLPERNLETQSRDPRDQQVASPAPSDRSDSPFEASSAQSVASQESGEASSPSASDIDADGGVPPLPSEAPPAEEDDDGWDFHFDATHNAYYFHNRFTNETTWENPRAHKIATVTYQNTQLETPPATAVPPLNERPPAGGYNPAIHGDYDPNAWYAQANEEDNQPEPVMDTAAAYAVIGSFNRFTGGWQGDDQNPDHHNDEAKSRRQMNAFFDVDSAANSHDGRSLKAERSGKKPTKSELKRFKEKRRARKDEKRRAWLRD